MSAEHRADIFGSFLRCRSMYCFSA